MTERQTCQICGNDKLNVIHYAREMLLGTRDTFPYLECKQCGFLGLLDIPANLGSYYPKDYYSFSTMGKLKLWSKRVRNRYQVGIRNILGRLIFQKFGPSPILLHIAKSGVAFSGASILDVGCGAGNILREFVGCHFSRLVGIDPFMRSEEREQELQLRKISLDELKESFDIIMFNHSFEHLTDPRSALQKAGSLLTANGRIIIRVPVASSWAWKHYGVHWSQLDPPRHTALFTDTSMKLLAQQCGLEVFSVECDSFEFQFWASELYKRDIPLTDPHGNGENPQTKYFSQSEMASFKQRALELNNKGEGDQAVFLLRRI